MTQPETTNCRRPFLRTLGDAAHCRACGAERGEPCRRLALGDHCQRCGVAFPDGMQAVLCNDCLRPAARHYDAGEPGWWPGEDGELGTWVLHVRGGGAFALNAVQVLSRLVAERPPGPARDVLRSIVEAFVEASPDYGD